MAFDAEIYQAVGWMSSLPWLLVSAAVLYFPWIKLVFYCYTVLQIRRGKVDNLEIFFAYYSFKTYVVTHH